MDYLPLSQPDIDQKDRRSVMATLKQSWISSKSPSITEFEELFAKKVSHTKYAAAVNSGTSALFLALKVLGVGPGDEVILPSFTMIATINAVMWVGAKPVLVDCASKTDWNLDISQIKQKINSRTKVIMPVHIYGYSCQMQELMALAKKHNLYVIEDAAEAMGSTYRNKMLGSFGDLSCYSLYANKIITTGNGGMVATNNKKYYQLLKKLSFFDFNEQTHFKHHLLGYNLVLSGLQAALGVSQVKKFANLLKKRRQIFQWYSHYLKNPNVFVIEPTKNLHPNYWFPAIMFKQPSQKKRACQVLENKGIETRDFFLPIHLQPLYKQMYLGQKYPMAEYFHQHGLLLPSYFQLSKPQVKTICKTINQLG
jgi:perosamine synthetase